MSAAVYSPPEADIVRVMRETGMDRMQAIYHLRGRKAMQERSRNLESARFATTGAPSAWTPYTWEAVASGACQSGGPLDAPEYVPTGSVRAGACMQITSLPRGLQC